MGACALAVPPAKKVGDNQSRRAAAKFFLHVGRGQPVVVDAKAAAHAQSPFPVGSQATPTRGLNRLLTECSKRVVRCLGIAVRNLLLLGCARAQVEVAEHRGVALGPRIAAVVIAQAQGQGQIPSRLPGVFDEQSKGSGSCIPIPQLLRAGCGVVHDAVFVGGGILRQLQQIVEGRIWAATTGPGRARRRRRTSLHNRTSEYACRARG